MTKTDNMSAGERKTVWLVFPNTSIQAGGSCDDDDDDDDDNNNNNNNNKAVHTDREVTANRPDIIIKNKKRENMHTDRCGNTRRQKCFAKGSGKEVKIQEFVYRDTTNVEPEIYNYTSFQI
jgi:hypothetical protein